MKSLYNILLGNGSNVAVNKFLIKNVGLEAGFLFSTLIDFENYLISKEKIKSGDWFYAGRDSLEEQTTLSSHKQKQAEKILLEAGLIEMKLKGVPAKNHYTICSDQVLKIFENWMSKNLTSSSEKNSDHITNNNTKKNIKEGIEPQSEIFKKIELLSTKLNINQTPYHSDLYTKLTEKIPNDKLDGYLDYLLNNFNDPKFKQKYLKNAFNPVAFYNWEYKEYLGYLNLELDKQKQKEKTEEANIQIIDSSKLTKQELEAEIAWCEDAKYKYKII